MCHFSLHFHIFQLPYLEVKVHQDWLNLLGKSHYNPWYYIETTHYHPTWCQKPLPESPPAPHAQVVEAVGAQTQVTMQQEASTATAKTATIQMM